MDCGRYELIFRPDGLRSTALEERGEIKSKKLGSPSDCLEQSCPINPDCLAQTYMSEESSSIMSKLLLCFIAGLSVEAVQCCPTSSASVVQQSWACGMGQDCPCSVVSSSETLPDT